MTGNSVGADWKWTVQLENKCRIVPATFIHQRQFEINHPNSNAFINPSTWSPEVAGQPSAALVQWVSKMGIENGNRKWESKMGTSNGYRKWVANWYLEPVGVGAGLSLGRQ